MSSLAFGHLKLRTPDKIDDSLSASRHGKPNATGEESKAGQGECFYATWSPPSHRSGRWGLTCPGWHWRSWLCRPSGPVWSPPRSRSCSAAPRHPNREAELKLEGSCGRVQSGTPTGLTVPSAFCPRWACAGQIFHRWGNSQRCLWERKSTHQSSIHPAQLWPFKDILASHRNFSADLQLVSHNLTFSSELREQMPSLLYHKHRKVRWHEWPVFTS